jgi:hypothetical protein
VASLQAATTAKKGCEVFKAIDGRTLGLGGAALLLATVFTGLLWAFRPDALLHWLMTLAATSISVVFAVALFWYQREKSDEARQKQLLISLVAEARACLDMLAELPAELRDLDGRELGTAVMEPLPTIVLDETIRSGVNHPSDTFGLALISAHIHAHNANVGSLASMEGNGIEPKALRGAVERLRWRQEIVADYCRQLVGKIEALGIPEPSLRGSKEAKAEGSPAPNISSEASATSES